MRVGRSTAEIHLLDYRWWLNGREDVADAHLKRTRCQSLKGLRVALCKWRTPLAEICACAFTKDFSTILTGLMGIITQQTTHLFNNSKSGGHPEKAERKQGRVINVLLQTWHLRNMMILTTKLNTTVTALNLMSSLCMLWDYSWT